MIFPTSLLANETGIEAVIRLFCVFLKDSWDAMIIRIFLQLQKPFRSSMDVAHSDKDTHLLQ